MAGQAYKRNFRSIAKPLWLAASVCASSPGVLGCNSDEFDWCTEAQDESAIAAAGTLQIDYQGRLATGPVSIEPFVKNDPATVLVVKGCGTDWQGTLWRFFGGWQVPEAASAPVQVEPEPTQNAVFSAELLVCKQAECVDGKQFRIVGLSTSGEGVVSAYAPESGSFASRVRVTNDQSEEVQIDANLTWGSP